MSYKIAIFFCLTDVLWRVNAAFTFEQDEQNSLNFPHKKFKSSVFLKNLILFFPLFVHLKNYF